MVATGRRQPAVDEPLTTKQDGPSLQPSGTLPTGRRGNSRKSFADARVMGHVSGARRQATSRDEQRAGALGHRVTLDLALRGQLRVVIAGLALCLS